MDTLNLLLNKNGTPPTFRGPRDWINRLQECDVPTRTAEETKLFLHCTTYGAREEMRSWLLQSRQQIIDTHFQKVFVSGINRWILHHSAMTQFWMGKTSEYVQGTSEIASLFSEARHISAQCVVFECCSVEQYNAWVDNALRHVSRPAPFTATWHLPSAITRSTSEQLLLIHTLQTSIPCLNIQAVRPPSDPIWRKCEILMAANCSMELQHPVRINSYPLRIVYTKLYYTATEPIKQTQTEEPAAISKTPLWFLNPALEPGDVGTTLPSTLHNVISSVLPPEIADHMARWLSSTANYLHKDQALECTVSDVYHKWVQHRYNSNTLDLLFQSSALARELPLHSVVWCSDCLPSFPSQTAYKPGAQWVSSVSSMCSWHINYAVFTASSSAYPRVFAYRIVADDVLAVNLDTRVDDYGCTWIVLQPGLTFEVETIQQITLPWLFMRKPMKMGQISVQLVICCVGTSKVVSTAVQPASFSTEGVGKHLSRQQQWRLVDLLLDVHNFSHTITVDWPMLYLMHPIWSIVWNHPDTTPNSLHISVQQFLLQVSTTTIYTEQAKWLEQSRLLVQKDRKIRNRLHYVNATAATSCHPSVFALGVHIPVPNNSVWFEAWNSLETTLPVCGRSFHRNTPTRVTWNIEDAVRTAHIHNPDNPTVLVHNIRDTQLYAINTQAAASPLCYSFRECSIVLQSQLRCTVQTDAVQCTFVIRGSYAQWKEISFAAVTIQTQTTQHLQHQTDIGEADALDGDTSWDVGTSHSTIIDQTVEQQFTNTTQTVYLHIHK